MTQADVSASGDSRLVHDGRREDDGCSILHVDMDAFYASCELRSRPELRGLPVIVGGEGSRGVVTAATYEARRFGIHSAMPMSRAKRLCPQLVVLPPDFELYTSVSAGVMAVFRDITPLVEPLSLDEAFLDVSGSIRRLGPPAVIAEQIRARVHDEQGITCTVGVASTKFVAKLASTQAKPDGLLVVPADRVVAFLHPLPVGALWGVGEKTEEQLTRLGLRTVGDIAHTPVDTLVRALGPAAGQHLAALAWGRDPRAVEVPEGEKSIGNEETFPRDVDDPEVIRRELLRLSEKVASRMRRAGVAGRTVSIKVRFADFSTITRSRTLRSPTDVGREVYATARDLYDALGLQRARLRLVGVRVEGLVEAEDAPRQLLLDEPEVGWREAEQAVDRAEARFGRGSVRPARLVPGPDDGDDGGHEGFGGIQPAAPRPGRG
ncbi:MAG: DNA polymerase IV [Candidatus Nanopelagicales bacterium]